MENVSKPEVFEYKLDILDDDVKSENCDASSNKSADDKYFCDDDFYLSEGKLYFQQRAKITYNTIIRCN